MCVKNKLISVVFMSANYCEPSDQTWKNHFFVNSEILETQIWRKKLVYYDKFEIATKQSKLNILPTSIIFLILTGGTWY